MTYLLFQGIIKNSYIFQKTINPLNLPSKFKLLKAVLPNITLQRVRMVHDNDLEIVLPHLIVGLMYVLMDPTKSVAINGFRLFTISRILYSAVYCAFPSWQAVWCSCLVVNYSLFCYMTINCLFITSIRFHMVFHDLLCYCW